MLHNIKIEDLKIEDMEFIGENYLEDSISKTEERKQKVLSSYDDFQLDKISFLNELYDNYSTKYSYFNLYNNYIHNFEKVFDKDLMFFSSHEIANIISSCTFISESTKKTLLTFSTQYCEYWRNKGKININPCEGLSYNKSIKNSEKLLKSKLYSKEEILNIIYEACKLKPYNNKDCANKTPKEINLNFIKPLILARMGIVGKQAIYMRNLKWKDINIDDCEITIHNEDETKFKTIKVDKWAIDILVKLQQHIYRGVPFGDNLYIEEFVIEQENYVIENAESGIINYNTLQNNIRIVFERANVTRISFAELAFTRQIELLLRRRKHTRLTNHDVRDILIMSTLENISLAKITTLKKKYEDLTGDQVFRSVDNLRDFLETTIKRKKQKLKEGDVEGEYFQILDILDCKLE
ncbi:hypothetical protein DVV91_17095 [Clostridium botulinum]|uniref:hypothetical protein n=1 Tax=Clostridium botulinum TaxID=1491 RepID=UPI0019689345|nr:hypothetical protein [Clostridium botulinum]MBN1076040.1 hypothetical protein [Clostridium botulinum]